MKGRAFVKKSIRWVILGILGVILLFIVIGIASFYNASENQLPIEMIAFNNLTDEEKDLIPASPKDSIVEKVPVNDDIKKSINKNYDKNQVYAVTFNNTETDSSG